MYLTLVFVPLLGALVAGFGGRYVGPKGAVWLTTSLLAMTFLMSCIAFLDVGLGGAAVYVRRIKWIERSLLRVQWRFCFDRLRVVMMVVVTSVSTLVHLYGGRYMEGDPHVPRFMSYLSLFTFFMLILVTAGNYLQLFVGWEGVGLCSYLLINFWFSRIQANKAAIKAMVVNRVGDVFLTLAMLALFAEFGRLDYRVIFPRVPMWQDSVIPFLGTEVPLVPLVSLLLFMGAVGKSAQLFLHTWLPDAMEGPTPVRALIHAATMVTAGVFLLIRRSPMLEYAPSILSVIRVLGAVTALMAATTGLLQNDLKRVIAYSTCSQLGYMVFACGLSGYSVAAYHLANHAFFKALLFLCAGAVIHAMADEQDVRRMGGLVRVLPYTYAMMVIGRLSLMGFPFLTGFYSKDVIVELAYGSFRRAGHFAHLLGRLSAFFTAFYRIRLLYLRFLAPTSAYRSVLEGAHEPSLPMALPLFLLSWGAIVVGYVRKDMIIGLGTRFWGNAIFVHPDHCNVIDAEFLPARIKLVPVLLSLGGGISAFILYSFMGNVLYQWKMSSLGRQMYRFFNRKWLFDGIYTRFISQGVLHHGYRRTYQKVDRGLLELLGPMGISNWCYRRAQGLSQFQSGDVAHYISVMLFGLLIVVGGYLFRSVGMLGAVGALVGSWVPLMVVSVALWMRR